MPTTAEQISSVLLAAEEMIRQARASASSGQRTSLQDSIYQYSKEIQATLNTLLSKTGVITDEEINKLDEQVRLAKKQLEFQKAEQTKKKVLIAGGLLVLGFGALWFITKNKK